MTSFTVHMRNKPDKSPQSGYWYRIEGVGWFSGPGARCICIVFPFNAVCKKKKNQTNKPDN